MRPITSQKFSFNEGTKESDPKNDNPMFSKKQKNITVYSALKQPHHSENNPEKTNLEENKNKLQLHHNSLVPLSLFDLKQV